MAAGGRNKSPISVDGLKHQDRRPNIRTENLRDFVAEDERRPTARPQTQLPPRAPSPLQDNTSG